MTTTIQHPIKAVLNHRKMAPESVLTASTAILTKVFHNPNFAPPQAPLPPFEEGTLKSANEALAEAIAAAQDAGKQAMAELKQKKEVVVKLVLQLAST